MRLFLLIKANNSLLGSKFAAKSIFFLNDHRYPLCRGQMIQPTDDQSRLDVAARGIYIDMDRTFLDIRVFNSRADTNIKKSLKSALVSHEKEKKRVYGARILEVEKSSFTPIVFSTTGTMGREAERF